MNKKVIASAIIIIAVVALGYYFFKEFIGVVVFHSKYGRYFRKFISEDEYYGDLANDYRNYLISIKKVEELDKWVADQDASNRKKYLYDYATDYEIYDRLVKIGKYNQLDPIVLANFSRTIQPA